MKEFDAPRGRRAATKADRVRLIIGGLTNDTEPAPADSDDFKHEVGAVVFRLYEPSPTLVEDERTGYDSHGDYHCHQEPVLKTELDRWNAPDDAA